jgi:antitoxin MazE
MVPETRAGRAISRYAIRLIHTCAAMPRVMAHAALQVAGSDILTAEGGHLTGRHHISTLYILTGVIAIMKVEFLKWGNSLALRVPKAFAQEIGASVGKAANMEVRDGKLVVEIAKPKRRRRRYTLEQLVAGIRPENRHDELEWGPPVGNEVW